MQSAMQHPLFAWANQFRAVVPATALALGLVAAPAAAIPQPAAMSPSVAAPAERACPADWPAAAPGNPEPLILALAPSPRPDNWTALLAGDNPRPDPFVPVPARAPVVAQSADAPAPVGDNRPATLGDLKETTRELSAENRELRAENRETRRELLQAISENREAIHQLNLRIDQIIYQQNQSADALWTAVVAGFIATFIAIIGLFLYLPSMQRELLRELLRELKTAPAQPQPSPQPAPAVQSAPVKTNPRPTPRFVGMKPAIAGVLFVVGVTAAGAAAGIVVAVVQ